MKEWLGAFANDLISFGISLLLIVGYHLYLRYRLRQDPAYSVQAVNNLARRAWVESVMQERRDIMAVQTLRNSIMAATFLASTAVLLVVGVLTLSGQGDRLSDTWHALNFIGATHTELWVVKLLLMLLDLIVAFFCGAMTIRLYHHAAYLINIPLEMSRDFATPARVTAVMNRAGRFYGIGMRAYYFTVPLLFWLFGPEFLLLMTALLVFVLFHLDRAPKRDSDLVG
jgi:uncharacterized membrane protein